MTEIYKIKNNIAPTFMKEVFTDTKNDRDLRNKSSFHTSNVKSVYNGTETISFRGPQIWSLVPDSIKNSHTLAQFKRDIKQWKPQGCMCRLCKTYIQNLGFI